MARRGRPPHPEPLTPAEARVLELVRKGMPNAEIAIRLGISVNTVRYHVSNLLSKASVESRQELADWTPDSRRGRRFAWLSLSPHWLPIKGVGMAALGMVGIVVLAAAVVAIRGVPTEEPSTQSNPPVSEVSGESSGVGALLIDYGPREGWDSGRPGAARGALVALSGHDGEEHEGWGPLNTGQAGTGYVSPDGSLLALRTTDAEYSGLKLQIVRTDDGSDVANFSEPTGLGRLIWTGDSTRLFGFVYSRGLGPSQSLWSFNAEAGTSEELVHLDFDLSSVQVAPDGETLYALGFRALQCCGIDVQGDPFVAVIDTATGSILNEIPIPGLGVGQRFEPRGTGGTEYNIIRRPDTAISPDGARMYIAHADSAAISIVNLDRRELEKTAEPTISRSRFERARGWLRSLVVSEASAKSGGYFTRQLLVSADGRWLYVTGTGAVFCPELSDHFACVQNSPLGLSIIEADTLQVVKRFDGIGRIAVSSDGQTIVGWSSAYDYRAGGDRAEHVTDGPIIIDAATLQHRHHVALSNPLYEVQVSSDGDYALVLSYGPGRQAAMLREGRCESTCTVLDVVDLETGEVVATREMAGSTVALVGLVPGNQ